MQRAGWLRKTVLMISLVVSLAACQAVNPLPAGEVIFSDDFSTSGGGWGVGKEQGSSLEFSQGGLLMSITQANTQRWSVAGKDYGDVILAVQVQPSSGSPDNYFGMICRYSDAENFYYLMVSGDGYYGIGKLAQGRQSLIGMDMMQFSDLINQEADTYNLTAACIGDSLTFAIDGKFLAEVKDDEFSTGDVGVIGGSSGQVPLNLLFDNFAVRLP